MSLVEQMVPVFRDLISMGEGAGLGVIILMSLLIVVELGRKFYKWED